MDGIIPIIMAVPPNPSPTPTLLLLLASPTLIRLRWVAQVRGGLNELGCLSMPPSFRTPLVLMRLFWSPCLRQARIFKNVRGAQGFEVWPGMNYVDAQGLVCDWGYGEHEPSCTSVLVGNDHFPECWDLMSSRYTSLYCISVFRQEWNHYFNQKD